MDFGSRVVTFAAAVGFTGLVQAGGIPTIERDALIALYDSTDGANWADSTDWLGDPGTECFWFGVTCDQDESTVTDLKFFNNGLTGTIPPELRDLPNLSVLSLNANQLSGPIPPELGDLFNLSLLILNHNQLTGTIPPELGNLTFLRSLLLNVNQLTGPIPAELGNLADLKLLDLFDNQLTGTIPPELGSLTNLTLFDLRFNTVAGDIPPQLGNLASLELLLIGNNQLTGSIPPELGNLAALRTMTLISNQLTGSIPGELGSLAELGSLVLARNHLTGSIPPELGNLAKLRGFNLSSNQLTGAIPPELGGLASLTDTGLELRWNALYTTDDDLRAFLNSKQGGGDWESTQTVGPENLAEISFPRSVLVSWDPVHFTEEGGRYLLSFSGSSGGPYQLFGTTPDKFTSTLEVTGLIPATEYFFVVQSQTDPHSDNQNTVTSDFSLQLSGTTTAASWVYGTGDPGGPERRFDGLALTNFSASEANVGLGSITSRAANAAPGQKSPQGDGDQASVLLLAGEQTALLRTDLFEGDPSQPAWIELGSETARIGTFFQFGTETLSQLDGGVAVTQTNKKIVLTRVFDGLQSFRGQAATTRLSILNPSEEAVTIELNFRPSGQQGSGSQDVSTVTRTIEGHSFLDERAAVLFGMNPAGDMGSGGVITGEVTQGEGVVAFEVIQLTNQSTVLGLNAATGNPTNRAYSAQLASQPGLFTSVNVLNLADGPRNVTLRAVQKDGSDQGNPVAMVLAPREQFTEDAGVLFGAGAGPHPAQGGSFVGSLVVEADGDGVVGDVIFGDSVDFAFAASLPLQSETFTEALFNQVANVSGFFTGLAFFYPEQQGASPQGPQPDAEITIQVFLPGGEMAGESTVMLAPGERISQLVEQLVGEIELAGGYVRVFSTEAIIGQMLFGVIGAGGIQLFSAVPPTVVG